MFRILILLSIVLVGCQTNNSVKKDNASYRDPANSGALNRFVKELANTTGHSASTIERETIKYIQTQVKGKAAGNWQELGISKEEAMKIESLYDELPYMNKVRKWVKRNIHTVMQVDRRQAEAAYNVIKGRLDINPYSAAVFSMNNRIIQARNKFKPVFDSISVNQHRINTAVTSLKLKAKNAAGAIKDKMKQVSDLYKETLLAFSKRGKVDPSIYANGNEIVESAYEVTRYTGQPGMGPGCPEFIKSASPETLAQKANVDLKRAELAKDRAIAEYGDEIEFFLNVPGAKRLTAEQLDDITVDAFKIVNGLDEDEARLVVSQLKKGPCKLY